MTSKKLRKVVIVGAGIGGPVLGMWLRRLGLEVEIAEARTGAALAEGAFLGVAPNGMNVLDDLGVATPVVEQGFPCDGFRFWNAAGRAIGFIDRGQDRQRYRWPLTMVRRAQLHQLLASEAARTGVQIHHGKRLVAIDRSNPREVVALFEDGTVAAGDVLLACDGARSQVRSLLLPDAPAPEFSGLLDFGGFTRCPPGALRPGWNEMVFGRRAFFGAFATTTGEVWWFHNGPVQTGALTSGHVVGDGSAAGAAPTGIPPGSPDLIRSTSEVLGPWPIHDLPSLPRWYDDRVCLLGDAAHAMSPSAGQGASLAMEDALVLARCLRDSDEPAQAFAAFERLRRPRVEAISRQARRNNTGKAPGPVGAWFRDRMLPLFLKLGGPAQSRHYGFRAQWQ